jgi:flagellum-specific ATP synthase
MTTLAERFAARGRRQPAQAPLLRTGRLDHMVGLALQARGLNLPLESACAIETTPDCWVPAEVVGFADDRTFLMPSGPLNGLAPAARVASRRLTGEPKIGADWLGRVMGADGLPLDGKPAPRGERPLRLSAPPINPLARAAIDAPMDVGVRSINALLTLGRGQRVGLFAGSGVGKSTLLGMMTRHTTADVTVVGLIGERGREVRDFVYDTLGPEGLAHACVIAAPADASPLARLNGARLATAVAEYFRDQGCHVLLLMDSLTRYAQAAREIGLAVGEPPATRGYPPSVFARIPQLVERAGAVSSGGSITGLYTVLTEGDDLQDPVADSARAILDGHIVLSRRIAEQGRFPAIDVEASVSRLFTSLADVRQRDGAGQLRRWLAALNRNRDLIAVGAYHAGADADTDAALAHLKQINAFLGQAVDQPAPLAEARLALSTLTQSAA